MVSACPLQYRRRHPEQVPFLLEVAATWVFHTVEQATVRVVSPGPPDSCPHRQSGCRRWQCLASLGMVAEEENSFEGSAQCPERAWLGLLIVFLAAASVPDLAVREEDPFGRRLTAAVAADAAAAAGSPAAKQSEVSLVLNEGSDPRRDRHTRV
mmetsp:Transcript_47011/g.73578  ORF Transcript_47011/g.73578 Transcript_47011/m.73578 type:complete len:154 (+) Transcript_47011:641-1102(+)